MGDQGLPNVAGSSWASVERRYRLYLIFLLMAPAAADPVFRQVCKYPG